MASNEHEVVRLLLPSTGSRERLLSLLFADYGQICINNGGEVLACLAEELDGYFTGRTFVFQTRLRPYGTDFRRMVWDLLLQIPYGQTRTYGWIADRMGIPGGARAIGQANRFNPIPLLIPCHRVIAAGGRLGGFSCGLETKKWLLHWEEEHRVSLNS